MKRLARIVRERVLHHYSINDANPPPFVLFILRTQNRRLAGAKTGSATETTVAYTLGQGGKHQFLS